MTSGKIEKENMCKFLKRLEKELGNKLYDLKTDFQKFPPASNQIRKRFMEWRTKYDQVVLTTLKEVYEFDEKAFDFKEFIMKNTEEYGNDGEFLQLLKNLNGSIESLKDFIRVNLVRDATIYEMKE